MISENSFTKAAAALGVPVSYIKAVNKVESPDGGFASDGQPFILFEAHVFSRLTNGLYDQSHPDISSRNWNQKLYAKGPNRSARSALEHKRLQRAVELNRDAALKSASWGMGQIMGENYKQAGYDTLQEFITAMYASEDEQLDAQVDFILADRRKAPSGKTMLQAMRAADWASFAYLYNGAGYKENRYDEKLRDAAKSFA